MAARPVLVHLLSGARCAFAGFAFRTVRAEASSFSGEKRQRGDARTIRVVFSYFISFSPLCDRPFCSIDNLLIPWAVHLCQRWLKEESSVPTRMRDLKAVQRVSGESSRNSRSADTAPEQAPTGLSPADEFAARRGVSFPRQTKRGGGVALLRVMPLRVNFDVHTRSVHVVPMHSNAHPRAYRGEVRWTRTRSCRSPCVQTFRHTRSALAGTVKRVATNPLQRCSSASSACLPPNFSSRPKMPSAISCSVGRRLMASGKIQSSRQIKSPALQRKNADWVSAFVD